MNVSAVVEALERAPSIVVALVREVPPAIVKRRPRPGKGSAAHEHACHLAIVHLLFFERLDLMLASPSPVITPYLPDQTDPDDMLLKMELAPSLAQCVDDRTPLVARL